VVSLVVLGGVLATWSLSITLLWRCDASEGLRLKWAASSLVLNAFGVHFLASYISHLKIK